MKLIFAYVVVLLLPYLDCAPPVVFWHGLGDSCCDPLSIGGFMDFLATKLPPGTPITSINIGGGFLEQVFLSYFKDANEQVAIACDMIANNPNLTHGYNAIGFSQGSQFLRAVAQRCPNPPMLNLITLGGQHQGVFGVPETCAGISDTLCETIRKTLDIGAYWPIVQKHLVPAQYWHDPYHEDVYRTKSSFIAEINNEGPTPNVTYKENLIKLKNLVLIQFGQDDVVIPRESALFDFYAPGQDSVIQNMRNTSLYLEDKIGLRTLDEQGRVHRYVINGGHLLIDETWFGKEIVPKFLL